MKAAVLIDTWFPFIGGGQINTYEISKILAKKGAMIDIITRNCGYENVNYNVNLKIIKLGKRSDPTSLLSKTIFTIRSYFYVYKKKYDLVHAHAFLPGITARLISVFKGTPSILTVHGTSIETTLNGRLLQYIERFILTKIKYHAQITVSRDFLNLKNVNKNIFFIPNAVNINLYDKVSAKKQFKPTILFVGRLHPQKNILTLIKAVGEIKKTTPDIRLIIAGTGDQKYAIKTEIKSYRLSKNIMLTGEVSGNNLIKIYKSCHLFVLPSIYEGQPLALLEAWAAKIPVITTKTGDSQYLVKDGINGYLINNPLDYKEVAKTIRKALSSKKLNKMGMSGYNFVKKNYSWNKSAELTLKSYESVAKASY